jgi:hypothetical protein
VYEKEFVLNEMSTEKEETVNKTVTNKSKFHPLDHENSTRNFFESQFERENLIKEKMGSLASPLIKPNLHEDPKTKLTSDENKTESECVKNQLEKIYNLLKEQEIADLSGGCPFAAAFYSHKMNENKENDDSDFKFSILKADGTYEESQPDLKSTFETQIKLYGLK